MSTGGGHTPPGWKPDQKDKENLLHATAGLHREPGVV